MDADQRELVGRLFAVLTAMLEDMIEIAVAGQASEAEPHYIRDLVRQLQVRADEIAAVAQAAHIIVRGD